MVSPVKSSGPNDIAFCQLWGLFDIEIPSASVCFNSSTIVSIVRRFTGKLISETSIVCVNMSEIRRVKNDDSPFFSHMGACVAVISPSLIPSRVIGWVHIRQMWEEWGIDNIYSLTTLLYEYYRRQRDHSAGRHAGTIKWCEHVKMCYDYNLVWL